MKTFKKILAISALSLPFAFGYATVAPVGLSSCCCQCKTGCACEVCACESCDCAACGCAVCECGT
ncbi:MAG: hypothetical protein JJT96_18910 [Opitutales bacterium]|nr:hypothetical protein [Opitutales bacterium]